MLTEMQLMGNERLGEVLEEHCEVLRADLGRWVVRTGGRRLLVVTDDEQNRMRIMTPITTYRNVTDRDARVMLGANFDRCLDSRYAAAGGYLWAVYLHPLAELTEDQIAEGLRQVVSLAENYGGSYSAGDLVFTGGRP